MQKPPYIRISFSGPLLRCGLKWLQLSGTYYTKEIYKGETFQLVNFILLLLRRDFILISNIYLHYVVDVWHRAETLELLDLQKRNVWNLWCRQVPEKFVPRIYGIVAVLYDNLPTFHYFENDTALPSHSFYSLQVPHPFSVRICLPSERFSLGKQRPPAPCVHVSMNIWSISPIRIQFCFLFFYYLPYFLHSLLL